MARLKLDGQRLWYTSDLHLFHKNIPLYQRHTRLDSQGLPYLTWHQDNETGKDIEIATPSDLERMHQDLVSNWNAVVAPGDTVMVLGDLAMGGAQHSIDVIRIVNSLNGRKYAVPGNHDTYVLDLGFQDFEWLPPLAEIQVGKQLVVLCHYPLLVWNRSHRGSWNLHGHSHHSLPIDTGFKRLDVGIDGPWGMRPVSHSEVAATLQHHNQIALDHHT